MALDPIPLQQFNSTFLKNNTAQISKSAYFPSDLADSKYWMSFSFYEYQRPTVTSILNGFKPEVAQDQGTIRLPLPNQMIDHQDQDYDTASVGTAISTALSMGGVRGESLKNAGAAALTGLGIFGFSANPMMGVMYKSPTFKAHQLMWRLNPSNPNESRTLNAIINNFKYHQLPESFGPVYKYPSLLQIAVSVNNPDTFTYVFRPAVIKSIEINFTPEGQPSFFNSTQAPTAVEIRLTIQEIELWTKQDYDGNEYPLQLLTQVVSKLGSDVLKEFQDLFAGP
jgi:hypothetical protein